MFNFKFKRVYAPVILAYVFNLIRANGTNLTFLKSNSSIWDNNITSDEYNKKYHKDIPKVYRDEHIINNIITSLHNYSVANADSNWGVPRTSANIDLSVTLCNKGKLINNKYILGKFVFILSIDKITISKNEKWYLLGEKKDKDKYITINVINNIKDIEDVCYSPNGYPYHPALPLTMIRDKYLLRYNIKSNKVNLDNKSKPIEHDIIFTNMEFGFRYEQQKEIIIGAAKCSELIFDPELFESNRGIIKGYKDLVNILTELREVYKEQCNEYIVKEKYDEMISVLNKKIVSYDMR